MIGPLRLGILFLVPFLVRAIVHLELRGDPFYSHLFVDARIYHEIARVLADGSQSMTGPHWQPPFYPQFVSWIYRMAGPDPNLVRWTQMILGSLTAVGVYRLGVRLLSPRAAWVAWAIVAFSGPSVFFDLQLLPASLASFLLVATASLLLPLVPVTPGRNSPRPPNAGGTGGDWVRAGAAGLLSGLAALTVGNLLLLVPACLGLLLWAGRPERAGSRSVRKRGIGWKGAPSGTLLVAYSLLALLPLGINTAQNYGVSGEFIPISYNGGINFWIGNNPDYGETVGIRPGRAWQALTAEPIEAERVGYRAQSDYFLEKSWAWFRERPAEAVALGLHKARLFVRGDEIPRNQELYPFRSESSLLAGLLFVRGIAFPSGLVLPLALGGLMLALSGGGLEGHAQRAGAPRMLRPIAIFVLLYSLSIVAFFVTSRYRVPLYPLFALLAAHCLEGWIAAIRTRAWVSPRFLGLAAVTLGTLVLSNSSLPAMTSEPSSDTQYDLGLAYQTEGDLARARDLYGRALALDPGNSEAHNNLAGLLLRAGDLPGARGHLEAVLSAFPDDVNARLNLVRVHLSEGDPSAADRALEPLRKRIPTDPRVRRLHEEVVRILAGRSGE